MKPRVLRRHVANLTGIVLIGLTATQAADVRQGLVSYWPLNTLDAGTSTTPDVAGGNHLNAYLHSSSDLLAGKFGNALNFNPDAGQYLEFTNPADVDTGLPVGKSVTWTVVYWVKANYPIEGELDRRVYSESSSVNTDPLVNLGTDNDADADGGDSTVDLFIRNSGTQVNHVHGTLPAYDGQWHHIALVDSGGQLSLYVDGILDPATPIAYIPGPTPRDVTSIGAIVRDSGASVAAYFRGAVDEVAVWERNLSQDEIRGLMASGIETPVPAFAPFVTKDPIGVSNLRVGDTYTLRAGGGGTRPLRYQWLKGSNPIPGATGADLTLAGVQSADSGDYSLRISNGTGSVTSAPATVVVGDVAPPNLVQGVIAYWPLDEAQGTKTPDIASGLDLDLVNITAADVQPGKFGNCFTFDLARQTMLTRVHSAGDALPIYQYADFSISLWVKGDIQSDKRVFSEGSTRNSNPLFNLGTHNTGADGTVDSYIRTDAGATSGDHRHSIGTAFDGAWHHIAYVQRTVGGVMQATLFVDGIADEVVLGPVRPMNADTTTLGGILRASPSAWYTGQIDDVALWNRAISEAEVKLLSTAVMPTPPTQIQPLAVNAFRSDLPAVAQGGSVTLRWDVSKSATEITIEPGVGNVTGKTVSGAGSETVTPDKTTTYTLTLKRGTETTTSALTVTVIDGVAAEWTLIDNFDRYNPGPLSAAPCWRDLRGDLAQVEDRSGNRVLSIRSADSAAVLGLGPLTMTEGQERTLFFRLITQGNPAAALEHVIGLTDKNIRSYGDASTDIGPVLFVNYDLVELGWFPGLRNGPATTTEYSTSPFSTNVVYSVWIDIRNVPLTNPESPYDLLSVHIQAPGDAARTTVFTGYLSDRDPDANDVILGGMKPDLDKLFVAGNNAAESALFDDFYLSKSGYNATTPRAFGFSEPVGGQAPSMTIALAAGEVSVSWTGGTLESAPSATGPWAAVPNATVSPYRAAPSASAQFYRARQ
jgi:hypothetical protein